MTIDIIFIHDGTCFLYHFKYLYKCGIMLMTFTPNATISRRRTSVKPTDANLDTVYAEYPGSPNEPGENKMINFIPLP